jgi:hypothetical protein
MAYTLDFCRLEDLPGKRTVLLALSGSFFFFCRRKTK